MPTNYSDPCTFSNPKLFIIKHIKLDWNVNFEAKKIVGSCRIDFELNTPQASQTDFVVSFRNLYLLQAEFMK